tara:strand:+ start:3301 stop:3678 length:378 start_codon:yes stop_codon:yes gene_type:complete
MNEVLDTLTKEQAEVLTERWNEMQQSLIKIGTDCLRDKQAEMDGLEARTVNPLHHLDMDMFDGKAFITSLMNEVKGLLLAEMDRLENKDEHQKNISGGVWELQDGEHDWMDALGSAIKATEEMIE